MKNFLSRLNVSSPSSVPLISSPSLSVSSDSEKNLTDNEKMPWGAPIWYLLHTLAEKILDDKFHVLREELLHFIYVIVCNLPCPLCSIHGKKYLDSIDFDTIVNKTMLKQMLFDFHNVVNVSKNYPLFTMNQLESKYSTAVTIRIVQNFMIYFEKSSGKIKLLVDDLYRKKMIIELKTFFNNNITCFLP